jgi:DNA-directed RNA polymerase beta' subunit
MPDMVTFFNLKHLQQLVNDGKANQVIKADGTKINLKYAMYKKETPLLWGDKVIRNGREIDPFTIEHFELREGDCIRRGDKVITDVEIGKKKDFPLEIGDTVNRQLKNGDVVLFNRQPTLHKASMLAKRVIVRPCRTFRFNLAATKTFNADQ